MKRSPASLAAAIAIAAASLSAFPACGEDSPDDEAAAGGQTTARGGSGGKASRGGAGGEETNGGAPAGQGGDGSGATNAGAPGSGDAGSGTGSGGSPTGGGDGGAGGFQVPGPAPGGGSVYAVECSGETAMCGTEFAHCLGLMLPDRDPGFACSNHCETVADCSDEPTGAEAFPGCVQFTMESRCMLMCLQQGVDYTCPDGMSCYVYPNATFGYCLWL